MYFIGERDIEVDAFARDAINHRILEFNTEKKDLFLQFKMSWDIVNADVYHVLIGESLFMIPTGYYVLIGDSYADFDWIQVDEMFNRDIEIATFGVDMVSWRIETPHLIDFSNEEFHWPTSKHVIPLQKDRRVIMVSEKDQYHKLKAFQLDLFTTN